MSFHEEYFEKVGGPIPTWADTATKPKNKLIRVHLLIVAQESRWIESRWIRIHILVP